MAYLTPDGDAERSDGRSTSPNSYHGSRYAFINLVGLCSVGKHMLTDCRPRSTRGRKEVGMIGQASWTSSVINLVNTSMPDRGSELYTGLRWLSSWCWYPRHAFGPLTYGNNTRDLYHTIGWPDCRLRSLPSDVMRQIPRPWCCFLFRSLANNIPKCSSHLRRGHCDQVLWCWG